MAPPIGLGQAFEMRFIHQGKAIDSKPDVVRFSKDHWWIWEGGAKTGTMKLVKLAGRGSTTISSRPALHARFHGHESHKGLSFIDPGKPLKLLGLCVAVAYDATMMESNKSNVPYRHYFGDTGSDITFWDPANAPACPNVWVTEESGLVLKRRETNDFFLDDWLIG